MPKNKTDYVRKTFMATMPNGKKKQIQIYGKTEKEALKKLAKIQAEYELGLRTLNNNTPFSRWADEYMETYYKPTVQAATYNNAKSILDKYLKPELGIMTIGNIRPAHIHNCLLQFQGMSKDYARKSRQLLFRIFDKAVLNEMINRNPVQGTELPKTAAKSPRRPLTPAEKASFMKAVSMHEKGIMFACQLACGLRSQEVRALKWSDIDLKKEIITIRHAVAAGEKTIKAPKSDAGYRTIPMPAWFVEMLRRHIRDISTDFVFWGTKDKPITSQRFIRAWSSFMREWDIAAGAELYRNQVIKHMIDQEITPYYLRHTYATELAENSVDIKTAQYLLGHSDIKMTAEIYTHVTEKMIETARAKINSNY